MEDALAPPPAPLAGAVLTRRRSHLDSASYRTLCRLFSHCLHHQPSRCEVPAPPEAEPAAANPGGGESDEPPLAPTGPDFDGRNSVGKEVAAARSPSRHETFSPARDGPAEANCTGDPGEAEAPRCPVENVTDVVVVESTGGKAGTVIESGVGSGLVVEDGAFKSVEACLEEDVDAPVVEAVLNDEGQLLLDAMLTDFTGLIDDVDGGTIPAQCSTISEGELQNSELKQSGDGVVDCEKTVNNSGHRQIDAGGFEEGEIEGEVQDLDSEESGDLELGGARAEDKKLEGDSVNRGSRKNESCGHNTWNGNLQLIPEIKGNADLISSKDASVPADAQMCVTRAQAVSYDEVVDWNETPLPEDEAPSAGKKRKHPLTEARKAKKTKNKRMKRAQERIAEGVNRLKLPIVIKHKPPEPCKYYNHGKCQKGSGCKFSHDFTPQTKSMPCKHFAIGSCLKGDECPYDHELSKYPCHKFQMNKCFRGDNCKFSHVLAAEGISTPGAKTSDSSLACEKTNLREHTSSKKASTVHNGESVASIPTKQQHTILQNLASISINSQKVSTCIPKGVQFLPFGRDGSSFSGPHEDALCVENHKNANGSKHQHLGGHQIEGQYIAKQNGQKPVPLLDEQSPSKEATMHPCSDTKKAGLPTDSAATPAAVHADHEVSEASRILQEFLFGSGS